MSKADKRRALEKELAHCQKWELFEHEAQLLQSVFPQLKKGMEIIEVEDWETGEQRRLPLDAKSSPRANVEAAFKKARKAKRGVKLLQDLLTKLAAEPDVEAETPLRKPVIVVAPRRPYRTFLTPSGMTILVGKSSRDNDRLTFHYAKREDYWFHAHGVSGSHVVLRVEKGKEPDPRAIEIALSLAHKFSKARHVAEAPVAMTQVKRVRRTGKMGAVRLLEHTVRKSLR